MDLLPGIQMRVVPPPMPLTPRPLPPLALRLITTTSTPRIRAVRLSGLPTLIRDGVRLSRRTAEQHPAQHRDLLRQLRDPCIKLGDLTLGLLSPCTPVRHISGITDHRPGKHVPQDTPSPSITPRATPDVPRTTRNPPPPRSTHTALTRQDKISHPTGSPNIYVLSEVHRSNMSKLDRSGKPIIRVDGKVLKSDRYSPPNVAGVLQYQAVRAETTTT